MVEANLVQQWLHENLQDIHALKIFIAHFMPTAQQREMVSSGECGSECQRGQPLWVVTDNQKNGPSQDLGMII